MIYSLIQANIDLIKSPLSILRKLLYWEREEEDKGEFNERYN